MSERLPKYSRRAILGLPIGVAAAAVAGCGSEVKPTPRTAVLAPTPIKEAPVFTAEQYNGFTSRQKLDFIEHRGMSTARYPEIPGFNPEAELAITVARLYETITPLKVTPEEMAKNTQFLNRADFIRDSAKALDRTYTPEQEEAEFQHRVEFVGADDIIRISRERIKQIADDQKKTNPTLIKQLGGSDVEVKMFETILFHAITHANNSQGSLSFDPFYLHLPGSDEEFSFGALEKYQFLGKSETTQQDRYINGANEAITEFIGRYVATKTTSGYVSVVSSGYQEGANLVGRINNKVGLSPEEFLKFNTTRTAEELMKIWAAPKNGVIAPDIKEAILGLAAIGLYVQGSISYNAAVDAINAYITPGDPIPHQ